MRKEQKNRVTRQILSILDLLRVKRLIPCILLFLWTWHISSAFAYDQQIQFRTYLPNEDFSTTRSGPSDPTFVVIRSMNDWTKAWNGLQSVRSLAAPLIDFTKFTLIMAGSGRQPSSGHAIAFGSIVKERAFIQVNVLKISPGKECAILDVSTSPVALALIPKTDRAIVFDIADAKVDCGNHEIRHISAPQRELSPP